MHYCVIPSGQVFDLTIKDMSNVGPSILFQKEKCKYNGMLGYNGKPNREWM